MTSAQARRTARADAAHTAATAPASYTCRVDDCPTAGVWHAASSSDEAARLSRAHYLTHHYREPD